MDRVSPAAVPSIAQRGLVLARPHVFSAREQRVRHLDADTPLADILAELGWPLGPLGDYTAVLLNGQEIARDRFDGVVVRPADYLVVALVPRGGGGGGKDNRKTILAAVASIAVAVFAPAAGAAIGKAYGLSAGATAAVSAAVGVVGALAVNALFGPRFRPSDSAEVQRGYTIAGQSNSATPYSPVLRIYGRHKVFPRVAANIYNTSNGVDQWATMILDFGYGPIEVEDLRVGDTPAASISGLQTVLHPEVVGDSPALQFYRGDVDQKSDQIELRSPETHVVTSSPDTDRIELDIGFPEGLFVQDTKKGYISTEDNAWVSINLWLREQDGEWQPWGSVAELAVAPACYAGHRSNAQTITFSALQRRAFTGTIGLRLPRRGTWDVQIQKTTPNWDTDNSSATWFPRGTAYFTAIRSLFPGVRPVRPRARHTMMEVFVRASEQVSGALQQINAIGTSVLRVWTGSAFELRATRNPAWVFADILCGEANPRPVPDARIDWEGLRAWAALCDQLRNGEPLYCYDAEHDSPGTVWEQLQTVAAAGRASPAVRDGRYTVIIDTEQTVPVQLFTPLNTSGFSASKAFLDLPHALKVQFVDPALDWAVGERYVYDDGYSEANATRFEDLTLRGVTRASQAWRDGRHWFAAAKLRREEVRFTTDVENLVAQRGDLVLVQSDVNLVGGVAARVAAVEGAELELDAPLGILSGSLGLRVREASGRLSAVLPVDQITETRLRVKVGHAAAVGDLVVVGQASAVTGEYLVKEVLPGPDLTAELVCVEVGRGIYNADQGVIPPYTPQPGGVPQGMGVAVINLAGAWGTVMVDRYPVGSAQLGWEMPANAVPPLKWRVYQIQGTEAVPVGETTSPGFAPVQDVPLYGSSYVDGQTLTYAVEPVWSALTGPRRQVSITVRVPAPLAPAAPVITSAAPTATGVRVSVGKPPEADVTRHTFRLVNELGQETARRAIDTLTVDLPPQAAGVYTVHVAATDVRGVSSAESTTRVTVRAPRATRVSGNAVANTAFLRWGSLAGGDGWSAQTDHMVEFYEVARERIEADPAQLERVGLARSALRAVRWASDLTPHLVAAPEKYAAEFAYLDEAQPGRWRYGVRAVDVAGNRGPYETLELTLTSPDNYELLDALDDWLPLAQTRVNALALARGDYIVPVNPAQTWRQHFESNGFASPAAQIAAGFPWYLQPGNSPAVFRWEHDFGAALPPLSLHARVFARQIAPAVAPTLRLYTRPEGGEWALGIEDGGEAVVVMPNGTRAVAIELELAHGADRIGLAELQRAEYRLEVRYIEESLVADVAAGGTTVALSKPFVDVRSVTLSLMNSGAAAFARYTVADDQGALNLYCFDAAGNPTAGRVSALVKGI